MSLPSVNALSVLRIGSRKDIVGGIQIAHHIPAKNWCSLNLPKLVTPVSSMT